MPGALQQAAGNHAAISALAVNRNRALPIQCGQAVRKQIERPGIPLQRHARFCIRLRDGRQARQPDKLPSRSFWFSSCGEICAVFNTGRPAFCHAAAASRVAAQLFDAHEPAASGKHLNHRQFADQNRLGVDTQNPLGPRRELSRERDVDQTLARVPPQNRRRDERQAR